MNQNHNFHKILVTFYNLKFELMTDTKLITLLKKMTPEEMRELEKYIAHPNPVANHYIWDIDRPSPKPPF